MSKKSKMSAELDKLDGLFDDPCFRLFEDEDEKKKRKKKKKKKAAKKAKAAGMSARDLANEEAYVEGLKNMTKKELQRKILRLNGVRADQRVEDMSRKELIKGIIKARRASIASDKAVRISKEPDINESLTMASIRNNPYNDMSSPATPPPFYFDESTREFVILEADTAPATTVYTAMRSLGAVRQAKKADDGFAELMDRIHNTLTSPDYTPDKALQLDGGKPIIEVPYTIVDDDDEVRVELPQSLKGKVQEPNMVIGESASLSDKDVQKLASDIDAALNTISEAAKGDAVHESIRKKRGRPRKNPQ